MKCERNTDEMLINENRRLHAELETLKHKMSDFSEAFDMQSDEVGYYMAYSSLLTMMVSFYRMLPEHPDCQEYLDEILGMQSDIVCILINKDIPPKVKYNLVNAIVYEGRGAEISKILREKIHSEVDIESQHTESEERDEGR